MNKKFKRGYSIHNEIIFFDNLYKNIDIRKFPAPPALTILPESSYPQKAVEQIEDYFGDVKGKKILAIGCGVSFSPMALAFRGADILSFDVSLVAVRKSNEYARKWDIHNVDFILADAENMPLRSEQFDIIYGFGILHHLNLGKAFKEIYRVAKFGSTYIFLEPLRYHPALILHRMLESETFTLKERELSLNQIIKSKHIFGEVTYTTYKLLSPFALLFRNNRKMFVMLSNILNRLDYKLLKHFPLLRHIARFAVIKIRKVKQ